MAYVQKYNRKRAVAYSDKWAMGRNPKYYDFSNLGGDCTNFISQCLFAGSGVMNYTPTFGWYYINAEERTPSWTAAQYLRDFLISNKQRGVFAKETTLQNVITGDVIQLLNGGRIYHSLFVSKISGEPNEENVLVNAHTFNAFQRPLSTYTFESLIVLHIEGVYL